jgi:hypothetical protein
MTSRSAPGILSYGFIVLLPALFLAIHFGYRRRTLRGPEAAAARRTARQPLDCRELDAIAHWARVEKRLFMLAWILFALAFVAVGFRMISPEAYFAIPVLGIAIAMRHRWAVRCPRCGFRLGFQPSGLSAPAACERCSVILNPASPGALLHAALRSSNRPQD